MTQLPFKCAKLNKQSGRKSERMFLSVSSVDVLTLFKSNCRTTGSRYSVTFWRLNISIMKSKQIHLVYLSLFRHFGQFTGLEQYKEKSFKPNIKKRKLLIINC